MFVIIILYIYVLFIFDILGRSFYNFYRIKDLYEKDKVLLYATFGKVLEKTNKLYDIYNYYKISICEYNILMHR